MVYSTAPPLQGKEDAPAIGAEVLGLPWGTLPQLPPVPCPHWLTRGPLHSSVLPPNAPRVPSFPADPPLLSLLFPPSEPPLHPETHRGWGHWLSFQQRRGPSPTVRLGGPQGSLGRASLSGPFSPRPREGPPSRQERHLGGGRGRGPPRSEEAGSKDLPQPRREGARGWRARGARPQVSRSQGDQSDAWPVPARELKSEGSGGAGIPSAQPRIRRVQFRPAGPE